MLAVVRAIRVTLGRELWPAADEPAGFLIAAATVLVLILMMAISVHIDSAVYAPLAFPERWQAE